MKIRHEDPEIYNYDHKFFSDSDFEDDEDEKTNKQVIILIYKFIIGETLHIL